MPRKTQAPKTKKQISRPKQEWLEFGQGLGRMRDASWARSDKEIKQAAQSLAEFVKDGANRVNNPALSKFWNPYQAYWYFLVGVKKFVEDSENEVMQDLINLGVAVPEIFSWDRMYVAPKPQKKGSRKK